MKFVVASADDRYTNLSFDGHRRFVINPGNPVLCRLKLNGCETPVTFDCQILDIKHADLKIYLSTEHREPDEKNNMRKVERLKVFKFHSEKKNKFGEDDVLYMSMVSSVGCTISLRVIGTTAVNTGFQLPANMIDERESIQAERNQARYLKMLDEKFDTIGREADLREQQEKERRYKSINFLKKNKLHQANFRQFAEEKRKRQQDRRQALSTNVEISN